MNVSACLVTRGDVDMQPILDSLPADWEVLVWDNGARTLSRPNIPRWAPVSYLCSPDADCISQEALDSPTGCAPIAWTVPDLAVYARYEAVTYAAGELIFTQDDDVIVSDPQAIVDELENAKVWREDYVWENGVIPSGNDFAACNMPHEFRPHYPDSGLVGFGAAFHRDAPKRAFEQFAKGCAKLGRDDPWLPEPGFFNRRADNVFTTLTPRVLVDVPKTDREFASAPGRMWKQPGHTDERDRMIELARRVRDAR